jgi:hypothetical protein
MIKLTDLITEFYNNDINNTYLLEAQYAEINELKIDELNSYQYEEISDVNIPGNNKTWQFEDRCGNQIVAVYLDSIGEFKSGYKIEGVSSLVFDPKKLSTDLQHLIKPCPDDKRVNTVYKILIDKVVPNYLLNKRPNRLYFNPVSDSRNRLVDIIINKIIKHYPQLKKKNNYIIYI